MSSVTIVSLLGLTYDCKQTQEVQDYSSYAMLLGASLLDQFKSQLESNILRTVLPFAGY